jgi:cyclopropane-fatty-acyl-phospholipid synthase
MTVADLVARSLGPNVPIAVVAHDGSTAGPADAPAKLHILSTDALRRQITAPGELGLARAYVAGEVEVEGDLFAALEALSARASRPDATVLAEMARLLGRDVLPVPPPPPEEAHLEGRRHSRHRDAAAIAHHYDVSNDFYRMLLGPTLTYSCALWTSPDVGLDAAQAAKLELVGRKLALGPESRLLDVGCGWGSMAIHAAQHFGARVVGITLSTRQADLARKRVVEAGVADLVDIRLQDERDIDDGPFDAVSSIGMFEHVGRQRLVGYFRHLHELLRPGGMLLNHGISRPPGPRDALPVAPPRLARRKRTFMDRYVFPDGELHEVGAVVSAMQQQGFEVRHLESLREHYALTLRAWWSNLEEHWDEAISEGGVGRSRVWRLYIAAAAVGFEHNRLQVHQVLAVKPDDGRSHLPLRPVVTL